MSKRRLKGKGNWTYGKHRSDQGRMGRGENALTAKEARNWKATLERIEAIVARAEHAGGEKLKENRLVLRLPMKAVRF